MVDDWARVMPQLTCSPEAAPYPRMFTRSQEAMRRLFTAKRDLTGNFPAAVFPDGMAPVVNTAPDGERELSMMRWGFPPPPNLGKVPVTNVRNVKSPYW
jgi:putative SOS response-associated peptidase YedK